MHHNNFPFAKLCLDPDVLEMSIRSTGDIRNDREDASTHAFRRAAYREFILAKYGCLGKGSRHVCSSCVVLKYASDTHQSQEFTWDIGSTETMYQTAFWLHVNSDNCLSLMKVKSYGDHVLLWCIIDTKFLSVWFSSFDKSSCFKKLEI